MVGALMAHLHAQVITPVGPGRTPTVHWGRYDGRLWVARLTRTRHATKVASTARCINMVTERHTTTTTAPRPPSTHHVRQVQTLVTDDQPKNWRATTQEPIARRQARRREEHRIRIDVDGVSSVNTKSLACTSARLTSMSAQRTGRQDSGDSKTLAKTVADHKKCDSEYQDQLVQNRRSPSPLVQVVQIRCAHSNVWSERSCLQHAKGLNGEGTSESRHFQTENTPRRWSPNSGRSVLTPSFSWTTSSHRPTLEVDVFFILVFLFYSSFTCVKFLLFFENFSIYIFC